MPEIRVALIMGGGVSLGSFSAGALIQTLRLFDGFAARHPIRIDVATGASAGSMTLAVALAHLYQGSTLDEVEAALEAAWVRKIDFRHLNASAGGERSAAGHAGSPPPSSILSDAIVREIAQKTLPLDRWSDRPPHPLLAEGALVSFALANLNGIPVRTEGQLIRPSPHGDGAALGPKSPFADALQTTLHADQIRFSLQRSEAGGPGPAARGVRVLRPWVGTSATNSTGALTSWHHFREAALASGAFPGAFPPIQLLRTREEYGALWPEELESGRFPFHYVDGGLFQNEPLREAIHLASLQDAHPKETPTSEPKWERVFVLIDPNVSGTAEAYTMDHQLPVRLERTRREDGHDASIQVVPSGPMDPLLRTLRRVGATVASQATFRDWLKAARVNRQVAWRDEVSEIFQDLVPREGSDVATRIDALLVHMYRARGGQHSGQERLQMAQDLAALPDGDSLAGRLSLLLDGVANLHAKRKLNLVAITPASLPNGGSAPLAGSFLGNFGGFFEERFRRHDYAVGQHMAARVLVAPIGDPEGMPVSRLIDEDAPIPPLPTMPDPPPAYRSLGPDIRDAAERLITAQVRSLLARFGVPGILRGPAASRLSRALRGALAAESPGRAVTLLVEVHDASGLRLEGRGVAGPASADPNGVIRTLVQIRRIRDHETSFWFEGPHVVEGGTGQARLALVEPRFLGSRPIGSIVLEGDGRSWWDAIRLKSLPVLRIRAPQMPKAEATGWIERLRAHAVAEGSPSAL